MPAKRKPAKRKRTKRAKAPVMDEMEGGSFKSFLKGVGRVAKKGLKFAKKTKLLSKGLSLIPDARAQLASQALKQVGLGKKRKARKKLGKAKMVTQPHLMVGRGLSLRQRHSSLYPSVHSKFMTPSLKKAYASLQRPVLPLV